MIYARFIGINKYADLGVPDLTGATRDATALWALFSDSVKEIDADLLVDGGATTEAILGALDEGLGAAGPDDDVILSFAGHGSPDHHLIAHDTAFDTWETTTIPMEEIAERFKQSSARSIICILDCCFSGAAPARVVSDAPTSRAVSFDAETFSGKGRVMITAAGLSEEAYEHPTLRHGLLTNAFIEVFSREGGPISLVSAMDEVQQKVRAEAGSMGRTQTPVLFGLVEGGLTVPSLQKGKRYRVAFPRVERASVSGAIQDLAEIGIPEPVVDAWEERFPEGLNELQIEAVNEYGVLAGESLAVVSPTSSGKTFIGEMAAVEAIAEGRKVAVLLPYRALVNEKYEDFTALYGDVLGLRVIRCSGDYLDETAQFLNGKFDIAVLTFEMFLSLAVGDSASLHRLGLVVVDEAQFIGDENRGIVVELLLTRLRTARRRGICPQLLLLSATIGGLNHLDDWLDLKALVSSRRPVPLELGVLDRGGTYEFVDSDGQRRTRQLISGREVVQRRSSASSQDVIVPLVRNLLEDEERKEKILIFRNRRGATEGCANYLAADLGLSPASEVIEALPSHDTSGASDGLRRAMQGGTAFHNSNLTRNERILVERAFRAPDGPVKVLVATSTVAAGVNTPASTVVIVEHGFPWANRPYTVAEVKNMAGRAGRLGYRETGRAILLAASSLERRRLFERYVLGSPEPVKSSFHEDDVGTWLIRLLAQVDRVAEDELIGVLTNTYGGYLRTRSDPKWQSRTEEHLQELVPRMLSDGLLERDGDEIQLTLLGQACGSSSLSLESSLRLVEMIRESASSNLTSMRLMALVQALPELDDRYTPLFRRGQREAVWAREVSRIFGGDVTRALQRLARDRLTYWARAKRASLLNDWISGVPIAEIEDRFTINPYQGRVASGDVVGIADTTRFHLRSASDIASLVLFDEAPEPEEMEALLTSLEAGIPEEGLALLELPVRLGRGEYLTLINAGITAPEEFWAVDGEQMEDLLGEDRTTELQRNRQP